MWENNLDFVTIKIPRPLAIRWLQDGLNMSDARDADELKHWLRAGFDWDNTKRSLFTAWGTKYLQ